MKRTDFINNQILDKNYNTTVNYYFKNKDFYTMDKEFIKFNAFSIGLHLSNVIQVMNRYKRKFKNENIVINFNISDDEKRPYMIDFESVENCDNEIKNSLKREWKNRITNKE